MLSLFDEGPCAPCPAPFNLAQYVLEAGQASPDKIALSVLGLSRAERWSFARLRAAVLGTAAGLLAHGVSPGDRVLMRLGNTVDFPVAFLGAIAAGAVPVPTSALLTEREVAQLARTVQPKVTLRGAGIACPDHLESVLDMDTLRGWYDLPAASFDMGDPDRLAYIVFTSGTSGTPRAAMHAHRAVWARRMMHAGWYGLQPGDRLLHAGAFNWTYTLGTGLLDPWTLGATALIPAAGTAPEALPLLMKRHEATLFAAAPGVYRNVLKRELPDLPKLRHGLSAGEKMPDPLRAAWEKATGTPVYEAFGMTEISTFISGAPDRPASSGALGRPQPGRRVAILGEDGPVPFDTPGVIAVGQEDPGLMLGYFGAEAASQAKLRDGWFLTGDLGAMSEDGQITYLGRSDDMMNAGGLRVSPIEVERAMAACPGISEIAVTDVEIKPDVRIVAAFYTGPEALPDATLSDWAQTALARYKQPRLFRHVPSLPRNPNGKLNRRVLREGFAPQDPEP